MLCPLAHGCKTSSSHHLEKLSKMSEKLFSDKENIPIWYLKEILDMSTTAYWVWDINTGHDYLSRSWAKLLGYKQDELRHHVDTWKMLMHPDDLPKAEKALNDHIQNGKDYSLLARYKHKLGEWIVLLDKGKVVQWSESGEPQVMVGFETLVRRGDEK